MPEDICELGTIDLEDDSEQEFWSILAAEHDAMMENAECGEWGVDAYAEF